MSSVPRVSRLDAEEVWQDVLSRAFQSFAFYHWYCIEKLNPALGKDVRAHTVRNAAVESCLMSVRDLADFFGPAARVRDDVVASDFGFSKTKSFLTADERVSINKKLAHLTYRAVHERRQSPIQQNPRTWNSADLVNRAMTQFLGFLDHLESAFFANDPAQQNLVRNARSLITQILNNLNTLAKTELEFPA